MNRHDPEGMAATMNPGYRSDQPVHPNRHFVGNRQGVAKWTGLFRGAPDRVTEVLTEATASSSPTVSSCSSLVRLRLSFLPSPRIFCRYGPNLPFWAVI